MFLKEIAYEAEEVQILAEKVKGIETALFEAVFYGNSDVGAYEWAFVVLGELTTEVKARLEKMTEVLFEKMRKEKEKGD